MPAQTRRRAVAPADGGRQAVHARPAARSPSSASPSSCSARAALMQLGWRKPTMQPAVHQPRPARDASAIVDQLDAAGRAVRAGRRRQHASWCPRDDALPRCASSSPRPACRQRRRRRLLAARRHGDHRLGVPAADHLPARARGRAGQDDQRDRRRRGGDRPPRDARGPVFVAEKADPTALGVRRTTRRRRRSAPTRCRRSSTSSSAGIEGMKPDRRRRRRRRRARCSPPSAPAATRRAASPTSRPASTRSACAAAVQALLDRVVGAGKRPSR